uniref:Ubiquitin-like domain-containing protein n=1 Tax=Buteo japonicus TaxID=224669 RepID=A0A8B9ZCT8_9AVES
MIDVHLMVHHHRTTIFIEAKETTTVHELKKMVEGILKRPLEEQRLYKDDQLLDDDHRTLLDCGLTGNGTFEPLCIGTFEPLCIDPFSSTPGLPDVKKSQLCGSSSREQTLLCCSVQAANRTVSWDPSPKLLLEEKGGSSWLCVYILNCKWHVLPFVFLPANAQL